MTEIALGLFIILLGGIIYTTLEYYFGEETLVNIILTLIVIPMFLLVAVLISYAIGSSSIRLFHWIIK